MNKIVYIKNTNALFLAIVLVAGTITLFSSSFIIKGVNAQTGPEYYDGMDDRYDSYEPDYSDRNNYEPTEYPSYKPEYPSDNSYKSKDNKHVSINKLKCINNNLNINGDNTGDVNVGNKGQGYLGTYSYGGYYDGYGNNKQGKGFDCIINNNNNNTIVVVNETTPEPPVEDGCVLCLNANATFAEIITRALQVPGPITISSSLFTLIIGEDVTTIPELCDLLREEILAGNIDQSEQHLREVFYVVEFVDPDTDAVRFSESVISLVECLLDVDFG